MGTVCYKAPEIYDVYDMKSDFFSLGLILFDLCNLMKGRKENHDKITYIDEFNLKFPEGFIEQYKEES